MNEPDSSPLRSGPSLTARALRLLSSREHSRAELERKLAVHASDAQQLAQVLDSLQAKGFINEARVVESLLHRRAAKFGAARVKQELQTKGLDAETVAAAMDRLRATELERARLVWNKRFSTSPADASERAKQMRFLASRGFAGDVIRRVVTGGEDDAF